MMMEMKLKSRFGDDDAKCEDEVRWGSLIIDEKYAKDSVMEFLCDEESDEQARASLLAMEGKRNPVEVFKKQ